LVDFLLAIIILKLTNQLTSYLGNQEKEEKDMKVLVFGGSGKMGSAVAWDLAKNSKVGEVGIIGITGRKENTLEKTIRWPGHWEGAGVLKECGMLDSAPIEFKGMNISPREFLSHIMTPKLQPLEGDTDVCVMWNTVTGIKDGQKMRIDYYMWEEADTENGISAMGRVTAFPEAIATVMLGKGEITKKGIVAPEDAIEGKVYQNFLKELKRRKINILEISKKI